MPDGEFRDSRSSKRSILDQGTLVPVGVVLMICGGAVWFNDKLSSIDYRLRLIEMSVTDRWTRTDQQHFRDLFQSRNPEIDVPLLPVSTVPR